MIDEIEQCKKDISYESEDLIDVDYSKLIGDKWQIGDKIVWCYGDDVTWWKKEKWFGDKVKKGKEEEWIKNQCGYSGLLFTFPEERFDIYENAIVCCYYWPVEKENPDVFWISLDRLLISPDLYKVYKI